MSNLLYDICICTEDGVEDRVVVQGRQVIEKDILAQGLTVEADHLEDIVGGKNMVVRFK